VQVEQLDWRLQDLVSSTNGQGYFPPVITGDNLIEKDDMIIYFTNDQEII